MKPLSRREIDLFHACFRKRRYSELAARRVAKIKVMRAYPCGNCSRWHLATIKESKR